MILAVRPLSSSTPPPKLEMILWLLMQNLHFIVLLFCAKIRKK